MATYTDKPLDQRLVNSALAALGAQSWVSSLNLTLRERDEDDAITPKSEGSAPSSGRAAKKRRLILSAADEGAHGSITTTPIRNIRLALTLRMNAKTADGDAEGMHEASAAVERWLDDTNLKQVLDSETLGVRVMMAARRPGSGLNREGLIRRQRYEIECKCVAVERTIG